MLAYLQGEILRDTKIEMSRVMFETAHGLAYLHEHKIIHGRLTLDNILLWMDKHDPDCKPIVKIADYNTNNKLSHEEKVIEHLSLLHFIIIFLFFRMH